MIDHLNELLAHVLSAGTGLPVAQIGFGPPDQAWRNQVSSSMVEQLSVYLVDLRENRHLRSNEVVRTVDAGQVSETPAPARLDCTYLVSAWSPIAETALVGPTHDEQILLYEVARTLIAAAPLDATAAYAPAPSGVLPHSAGRAAAADGGRGP